jgi:ectoine hydroxylase-related dioxygenase (phytanoyl-CoA dioxygenase family)
MTNQVFEGIDAKRAQFRDEGFVIVRGAVPAEMLDRMRRDIEIVVQRERAADPKWDTTNQPRASIGAQVDADTLGAFEFVLHDNTYGFSAEMLDSPMEAVASTVAHVICNPEFTPDDPERPGQTWGTDPRNWHRDFRPDNDGPLEAVLADHKANTPGYIQWNIALYEDHVLFVVPGSHRRLNSEIEAAHFQQQRGTITPLPTSLRVELNPGDGVAYNNVMLHWGSKYTHREKRRTIQLGYRSFGKVLPNSRQCVIPVGFRELFPEGSAQRETLERWADLFRAEFATIEDMFRASLAGDNDRFHRGLARLHPAEEGRLTCLIVLSKFALIMHELTGGKDPYVANTTIATSVYERHFRELVSRFSNDELERVWERFAPVDSALKKDDASHVSGFLGPTTEYEFERIPAGLTTESVCAAVVDGDCSNLDRGQ